MESKMRIRSQTSGSSAELDVRSWRPGMPTSNDNDEDGSCPTPCPQVQDMPSEADDKPQCRWRGCSLPRMLVSSRLAAVTGRLASRVAAKTWPVIMWTSVALLGLILWATMLSTATRMRQRAVGLRLAVRFAPATTLVMYSHAPRDSEYERNLRFFVRFGMWDGDGCDYLIIVQQGPQVVPTGQLPDLPRNAQYVFRKNQCYDWGAIGWAMAEGKVDTSQYKHIIFMSSTARGPFLPPYWPETVHWSAVFLSRLSASVKLVGATISCEPTWLGNDRSNEMRQNPHVESYVMATDQEGLSVMSQDGHVFNCYNDMSTTNFYAELGASRAVLAAGYTIDSLMLKYKDTDWTDRRNWNCSGSLSPHGENAYDGINLNPMEVLFIKIREGVLQSDWSAPFMATVYDRWLSTRGQTGSSNYNDFLERQASYRLAGALMMWNRGSRCFDFDFYKATNPDLPRTMGQEEMWAHFFHDGQFEARPFRFSCANALKRPDVAETVMRTLPQRAVADTLPELEPLPAQPQSVQPGLLKA